MKTKRLGLTSYQLKWIAVITMVIDHTGAVLYPECMLLRYIGRLAFPIFAFLLVEGYSHTSNVRRYMIRLGAFALISEIPFDLALREKVLEFGHQNVFFTLFFGVVLLYVLPKAGTWVEKILCLLLVMWITVVLRTDYSYKGILLVFLFYIFRDRLGIKLACGVLWNFLWNGSIQRYGGLAMIPITLYNGEKGRGMKYFFYLFYPVHLLILAAIASRSGVM